jgi:hypothetical protein
MTMRERARLGAQAANARYVERAETLRQLLEQGEHIKRAAWKAGMAHRTARRWRQRFDGQ